MPAPVYSAGTPGNVISGVSVAKGTNVAAFLDLSTVIEGQLNCEVVTGTAPTAGTVFSAYRAYAAGAAAPITLTSAVAAGTSSTTLSTSGAAGLSVGQVVALIAAATKVGETVTITSISGSSSPYTIGITGTGTNSGTVRSYAAGDGVYYMGQTAAFSLMPSSPSGTWSSNKDYAAPMFLGTGQWIIAAANGDATQTVTVNVTADKVTSFQ